MIRSRRMLWLAAGILAGLWMGVIGVCSASAGTPQGWWRLDGGARPTIIPASAGSSEQEITLEALTDPFNNTIKLAGLKVVVEGNEVGCLTTEATVNEGLTSLLCGSLPAGAEIDVDAAELQATLRRVLGSEVEVVGKSGGPGMVGSGEPLLVKAAGRGLPPVKVIPGPIAGLAGTASVQVISQGGSGKIVVQAFNLGDAPIESPNGEVSFSDKLPAGLVADGIAGSSGPKTLPEEEEDPTLKCDLATVSCAFVGTLLPYERLEIVIWVKRTGGGTGGQNEFSIEGGGVAPARAATSISFGEGRAPFGVESYMAIPEEEGGTAATQATGHPFQISALIKLNEQTGVPYEMAAQSRNLTFELPAGFVGDADAVPKCSFASFSRIEKGRNACLAGSTIGVASAEAATTPPPSNGFLAQDVPVFNLTPARGEPARFGFIADNVPVILDTQVRSGGDYGVTVSVSNVSESAGLLSSVATLWGNPGSPVHDRSRGWGCFIIETVGLLPEYEGCGPSSGDEKPLLTMPSNCEETFAQPMTLQSWEPEARVLRSITSEYDGAIDGCGSEAFQPSLTIASTSATAYSPTELNVHLKVPQAINEVADATTGEADVRNTKVTLPAGLQLNPSAAGGLSACTEQEIGFEHLNGSDPVNDELVFSEESAAERDGQATGLRFGSHNYGCPEASKVGTVKIKSPLLEEEITGSVYQAAQAANPFGSLLALYIVAEAPERGVRVRVAGDVKVEPGGQIVSTFNHTPQLPFEEFELKFFGGGKAPLATSGCGNYTTSSLIESWAGGQPASPFSSFTVSNGCAAPGFTPGFAAGTTNNDAGAFSPFVTTLTRNDGEQAFSTVSLTMPKGLLGTLSKVTLCKEPQANTGDCSAASKIGHVRATAGIGDEPIVLPEPGKPEDPVYLTGPYKGAPFGLSIVVPAEAGPFNLDENGHPVVVRAKIEVNPVTSQITIKSDPMPTELQNIPLDVRSIEVSVNKPGFMFNPTDCAASSITGTISSSQGTNATVKSRFQAANCATLAFKPQLNAYTKAGHTRRKGGYLQVVVKSGKGQANISKVHVTLPKDLPTREETLKYACSEKQFAANPAGCPKGSFVGTAKATTPVLPVPVSGPAIFVSHGGAEFPNLDVVLQGDGVTVDLTGDTSIKKGITTSTFNSLPDVPVERFEITLPQGKYSALAAEGNLCKTKPTMPTTITGQNGATINQTTKITITGCKTKTHHNHKTKKTKKKT